MNYNSMLKEVKTSYEVTEIELLEGTHGERQKTHLPRTSNNSITAAKLLKKIVTTKENQEKSSENETEDEQRRKEILLLVDKGGNRGPAPGLAANNRSLSNKQLREAGIADNAGGIATPFSTFIRRFSAEMFKLP